MRIGFYLGRHAGRGGGMAIYARSFVKHLLQILGDRGSEEHEVVLYGTGETLDYQMLNELHLSPVLCAFTGSGIIFGAGAYFKRLPNGARCRVLVRLLPQSAGRYMGGLLDQVLLPLLAFRDRLDLLHCAANTAILAAPAPQIATVHDLYQAWPPPSGENDSERPTFWRRLTRAYYRRLFALQFPRLDHVITDSEDVLSEAARRYHVDRGKASVIPLGIDEAFVRFLEGAGSDPEFGERNDQWLRKNGLEAGYVLVFASADPRKNLQRTITAWCDLDRAQRSTLLVIKENDAAGRREAERLLKAAGAGDYRVLAWLEREEMPLLYYNAAVVLVPTLAEGFGLPAIEAAVLGARVVSGPLAVLKRGSTLAEALHVCNPADEKSIKAALQAALGQGAATVLRDKRAARTERGRIRPRSMSDVVRETMLVYRKVGLQRGA